MSTEYQPSSPKSTDSAGAFDRSPKSSSARKPDTPSASTRIGNWLVGSVGGKGDRTFRLRLIVQAAFALGCTLLGVQFARFTLAAQAGQLPLPQRPPGAEAFLPLSGIMGLLDWYYQGTLNRVHPAATLIFVIIVAVAFFARKSFCSWICPVGFLSELLARVGRKIFGRNFRPWKWLDIALRSLKYLVLFFFVSGIVQMSDLALRAFIESSYNRVADVKMGLFFVRLGFFGAGVIVVLTLLSVLIHGFWCRYLCPYGALLGIVSRFSPLRVERDAESCIDCGLCDKVCMARLPVSSTNHVSSMECTGCIDCVATCPVQGALVVKAASRWRVDVPAYALTVLLLFLGGYAGARLGNLWDNDLTDHEYVHRIQNLDQPEYAHPGG